MTFVESIKTCFSKYADFKGRASRSEYWWFTLFSILVNIAVQILAAAVHPILAIVMLGLLLPGLAVSVRRLHDTDHSGWFLLIGLIPVVGVFIVLYFMIIEGKEPNRFGPSPATSLTPA
jgi:uncharacterized membrane protein YhaH (DUF805 family)